jgi:hypothetical protein
MKIKQRRTWTESTEYHLAYAWPGTSSGFQFPCDSEGNVNVMDLNPDARRNYLDCSTGVFQINCHGVQKHTIRHSEPAIGICDCGEEVVLQGFTCTCHGCGADYNSAGQKLAPRSQWGCETGESVAEILAVDNHTPLEEFDF